MSELQQHAIQRALDGYANELREGLPKEVLSVVQGNVNAGSWTDQVSVAGYVSCIPTGKQNDESIDAILSVEREGERLSFVAAVYESSGRLLASVVAEPLMSTDAEHVEADVRRLAPQAIEPLKLAFVRQLLLRANQGA